MLAGAVSLNAGREEPRQCPSESVSLLRPCCCSARPRQSWQTAITARPRTAIDMRTLSNTRSPWHRKPGTQGAVWSRIRHGPSPARAPMDPIAGRRATYPSGCTAVRARSASAGGARDPATNPEQVRQTGILADILPRAAMARASSGTGSDSRLRRPAAQPSRPAPKGRRGRERQSPPTSRETRPRSRSARTT